MTATLTATTQDRIRAAYAKLAPRAGAWIGLLELRAELADVDHDEMDAALKALKRNSPEVFLSPESNQKTLTAEDRDAALWIGDQWKHLISIWPA